VESSSKLHRAETYPLTLSNRQRSTTLQDIIRADNF